VTSWILSLFLMIGLQAQAQTQTLAQAQSPTAPATAVTPAVTASPQAEIAVIAPTATNELVAAAAVAEAEALVNAKTTLAATSELKETEIPVNLDAAKKTAGGDSAIFKFVLSFAILGVMGCAAYFLARKYKFKNPQAQATQIKVLTQHYLGPKKSLAIVRVAGESILIGITDQNISMLKSLSLLDEDIPEESPKEFHSIFAKKTQPTATARFADDGESKDEFSISGIKDIVSGKLKNMRSLE
jgi:flagellar protein FliO/FliZ